MSAETVEKPVVEGVPAAVPAPETIRLQPTRGFGRVLAPRELWRYRDLAVQIAARDVTVRYRQTALGAAWAILQPVGFMVVFSLFFGRLAGVSSDGLPYAALQPRGAGPLDLLLQRAPARLRQPRRNSALVSKIYFPRIFIPAGVVAAGLVDLGDLAGHPLRRSSSIWGFVPSVAVLTLPLLVAIAVGRRARRQRRALRAQRALPRRPLRRPLRDPDVALRHPGRLSRAA